MFIPRFALFTAVAAILANAPTQPGDNVADYLTKDGKLANPLEIRDTQGGFAGFTGDYYKVAPDGKWSTGKVFNQKMTEEKSGTLSKDDLAKLAKELAKFDLAGLKNAGKTGTNPHVVTIKFGKVEASLSLGAGVALPKVDAKAKALPVEQRYAGVVEAVRDAIGAKLDRFLTKEGNLTTPIIVVETELSEDKKPHIKWGHEIIIEKDGR